MRRQTLLGAIKHGSSSEESKVVFITHAYCIELFRGKTTLSFNSTFAPNYGRCTIFWDTTNPGADGLDNTQGTSKY